MTLAPRAAARLAALAASVSVHAEPALESRAAEGMADDACRD